MRDPCWPKPPNTWSEVAYIQYRDVPGRKEPGTGKLDYKAVTKWLHEKGFKGGEKFWFAEPKRAFWLPIPSDKGPKHETILYEANRLDDEVRFTADAAKQLTGVPKPFLKAALKGIIKEAKEQGVVKVDKAFVDKINAERNSS